VSLQVLIERQQDLLPVQAQCECDIDAQAGRQCDLGQQIDLQVWREWIGQPHRARERAENQVAHLNAVRLERVTVDIVTLDIVTKDSRNQTWRAV
jgi:hypothetical protein